MEKGAIRDELNKVRAEIKKLKKEFLQKKDVKEEHFEKGEAYSADIDKLYEEIKQIEKENNLDVVNKDLEGRKEELETFKSKLSELDSQFEDLKKSNKSRPKKPLVKTISAEKAKKEIKKLDLKLQTQVLSLDKESEIIRKMHDLKEEVGKYAGKSSEDDSEFRTIKKELNYVRRKYNNTEKKLDLCINQLD